MAKLRLIATAAVIAAAGLTSGVQYEPEAEFVAVAASLSPETVPESNPDKPEIVIRRTVYVEEKTPHSAPQGTTGGASYAEVGSGGNCVACVVAWTGRSQSGNAGTWAATHSDPRVGDIMILRPGEQGAGPLGHVLVVAGINESEIIPKHCNWSGPGTLYDNGQYF